MMETQEEIKPGYKLTKLGWIPEDWEIQFLKELFTFKNGVNSSKESYGNGIKFINVMEVINSDVITVDKIPGSITLKDREVKHNLVEYGDVLFNRTSETPEEIGLSAVYVGHEEVVFGGFVIKGKPLNNDIDIEYRKYFLSSEQSRIQIIKKGQGAVRANIGQRDLEKVLVALPPLREQKAIAQVLSTWDKAIEKLTKLIELKQQKKKALMQQLLTGKKRFAGFVSKNAFKGTKIGLVPEDWDVVKAKDLFKSISIKKNNGEELLAVTQDRGAIPRSMLEGRVMSPAGSTEGYKLVVSGNFIISLRSFQGGLEYSEYRGIVSPAYTILEAKTNLDKVFFRYFFKSQEFISRLSVAVIGIRDGKQIAFNDFGLMDFRLPSYKEQVKISSVLKAADNEINLLHQKLERLNNQKKGLMQQLLTGKKRIKIN